MRLPNTFSFKILSSILFLGSITHALSIVDSLPNNAEADYVIVGGGVGGLTTANRLAAAGASVIVIEAGPNGQNVSLINDPFQVVTLITSGQFNWKWPTVAQKVGGKSQTISGGKVLGGSSSINGMDWTRGSKDQYDTIATLNHDDSWNWDSFSAWMRKAEQFVPPNDEARSHGAKYNSSVHGYDGLVKAGYANPWNGWAFGALFVKAAKTIWGLNEDDLCSGYPNAVSQTAMSLSADGSGTNIRSSAARSYIYPFIGDAAHAGLTVVYGQQGTRILWSNTAVGGKAVAVGVEYAATADMIKVKKIVKARKEVIVAAGAIQSPAFLQLSGVGETNHLNSVGIAQVVNLPSVGTNLQDQALLLYVYAAGIAYFADPAYASVIKNLAATTLAFPNLEQLVGKTRAAQLISNLRTSQQSRAKAVVAYGGSVSESGLNRVFQTQTDLLERGAPAGEAACGISAGLFNCAAWPLLPQYRGTIKIASNDPFRYPIVDPHYLDTDFDIAVAASLAKTTRQALHVPDITELYLGEVLPFFILPLEASESQYAKYVASNYQPVYHPVGSVPMLPQEDGGSLDTRLRLYGTANVRVIDASALPVQLSAHLSSTVYGFAEKGASMILEDNP